MDSQVYSSLKRAQLTCEYLHTNSTTHEFLFGALAELVDNARDASSTSIDIYSVPNHSFRGKFILCFLDDGDGMDPSEVANVVQFGRSVKRQVDSKLIGQYGNGLKSGTMRIGKDMILFTRKAQTMSCLFLSRTFHEKEKIEEVVVPMPSWNPKTKKPLATTKAELDKHNTEVDIILKYSPFKTEGELMDQFAKIRAKGTLVAVYNMKLMDNGDPELDVSTDPRDILMGEPYSEDKNDYDMVMPERKSFRAYTAILYLDPRMKIYVQHKKVQTKRLTMCLYKPRSYKFTSKRFKTRSEKDTGKAEQAAKLAMEKARELEIQAKEVQEKFGQSFKDSRVEHRRAEDAAAAARADASLKMKIAEAKKKSLKEPKTLTFTFGFNLEKRACYGMFIYNCSRLIKMYEKVGPQLDGGVKCFGVVGVVDVPYLVLEPTHNKQDFADHKEFKHLTRSLGEHLEQYWKDSSSESSQATKFWESFGYIGQRWNDDPSNELKYSRKRAMHIPQCVQCAACLKWRQLPFSQRNVGREFPAEWCCNMNPDVNHNTCDSPEQKVSIPVGSLPQKQTKSVEEKTKEMEEQIRKKKEKLNQLNKQSKPQNIKKEEPVRKQPKPSAPARSSLVKQLVSRSAPCSPISKEPAERVKQLQVRRTPSADSTNSPATSMSRSDQSPGTRRPVADSTENHKRVTSSKAPKRPPDQSAAAVEDEFQPKRKKEEDSQATAQDSDGVSAETGEMEWSDVDTVSSGSPKFPSSAEELSGLETGKKVEAKVIGKWYAGTIVATKAKKGPVGRVRVKFDNYPKDKYDKWFDHPSSELRVFEIQEELPTIPRSPSPAREMPSTTTTDPQPAAKEPEPAVMDIADLLRRCLGYFAPPSFTPNKEAIKQLSVDALRDFSLENFCDEYEKGLKKLIGGYVEQKQEAVQKAREAEEKLQQSQNETREVTEKLRHLRRVCAKLIRSLNEDPDDRSFGGDDDSEAVDRILAAIADQAEGRA